MEFQMLQKSRDLICIKGADLCQAITTSGVLNEHRVNHYYEDSDPLVMTYFPTGLTNPTATLDFNETTREKIVDLLTKDHSHTLGNFDFNTMSTPILLADYLFVALRSKSITPVYKGYFESQPLSDIFLVSDKILFDIRSDEYKVIYTKNLLEDTIKLNPKIVWGEGGDEAMLVSWGRYLGPKKAHLSPMYIYSEISNPQQMLHWGNLYVLKDVINYPNLMKHIKEKIYYENDYRRKIVDVVKS